MLIQNDKPLLPISAIAATLEVHQRTLRIYDEEGILKPNRNKKNRRLYSINDFKRLEFVLFLTRNLSLNLSGVKVILSLMKNLNINPQEYLDYIKKTALEAGINEKIQKENTLKNARKGRKKK